jgi:hypothetical protein
MYKYISLLVVNGVFAAFKLFVGREIIEQVNVHLMCRTHEQTNFRNVHLVSRTQEKIKHRNIYVMY